MKRNYLGDLEFEILKEMNESYDNSLSKRRREDGYQMSDHSLKNPIVISLKVSCNSKEWKIDKEKLIEMRNSDKRFDYFYLREGKIFSEMAINSLKFVTRKNHVNGFTADITIEQMIVGKANEAKVEFIDIPEEDAAVSQSNEKNNDKKELGEVEVKEENIDKDSWIYSLTK